MSGCGTVRYLFQASRGQMSLLNRAQPIAEVLDDDKTPPRIRKLLGELAPIKRFGEANGLKPTRNYTEYVKLDRSAAVYVVSACEALRFRPKEWRFPIVGGFPYLGWFDLGDARDFARELKTEHPDDSRLPWDVDVRGASAYSTLGWFRDAVLSTMIAEGPEALGELVNVVLHESVHATIYVAGQGYFNESIASFIADHLTDDYLDRARGTASPEKADYHRVVADGQRIERRFHETYGQLEALYGSAAPDDEKLRRKDEILKALKAELKFRRDINNATLFQYKAYHAGTAAFDDALRACGGDWNRFVAAMKRIDEKAFASRQQEELKPVLEPVVRGGCR